MCGLFGGMANYMVDSEKDSIKELGLLSSLRGRDSTGVLMVHKKAWKTGPEYTIEKDVLDSSSFLWSDYMSKQFKELGPMIIAGHTRFATIGEINPENAHPFEFKHIKGMINGTVNSFAPSKERLKDTTDSKLIIESIGRNGIKKTIEKAEPGGEYAIVYVDAEQETLHFIRNEKRPLYYVSTQGGCLYWASEFLFLEFIKRRNHGQFGDIKYVLPHVLYTFEYGKTVPSMETIYVKPEVKPVVKKKDKKASVPSTHKGFLPPKPNDGKKYWWSQKQMAWLPILEPAPKTTEKQLEHYFSDTGPELDDYIPFYQGYSGKKLTEKEAYEMLANGCEGCGHVADVDDKVAMIAEEKYLCGDCMDDPFQKEYSCHMHKTVGKKL